MDMAQLSADTRSANGKGAARKLRTSGKVPAVVYGLKRDPVSVSLHPVDLQNLIRHSPWRKNTVFNLSIGGQAANPVMLQEIQVHPVSREVLHVDLLNIDFDKKLRAEVPVALVGRPEGVKAGGLLQQMARSLKVECLPKDLPVAVQVDVSHLERKQTLMIEDVKAPEGCSIVVRESIAIAIVS